MTSISQSTIGEIEAAWARFPKDTVVEVCVDASHSLADGGYEYGAADFLVEGVTEVLTSKAGTPWVTIHLGDLVCDHP